MITKEEIDNKKKVLITEFFNQMRDYIIGEIPKMPEDWDGIELRWYIERAFEFESPKKTKEMTGRYRDFKNEVLVRGLNY